MASKSRKEQKMKPVKVNMAPHRSSAWTCSIDELLYTINKPAWDALNEWSAHKQIANPLHKFKGKINRYFKMKKIDGKTFKKLNSDKFVSDLTAYIKSINKKQIQIAVKQLYIFVEDYHPRSWRRSRSMQSTPKPSPPLTSTQTFSYKKAQSASNRKPQLKKQNTLDKIWTCSRCMTPNNILEVLQKGDKMCLGCDASLPPRYHNQSAAERESTNNSKAVPMRALGEPGSKINIWMDPVAVLSSDFYAKDIRFKWDEPIKRITGCNHVYFLYLVSRTIDSMNRMISTQTKDKITMNKQNILTYLHKIQVTGAIFATSKSEFVRNVKQIIFDFDAETRNNMLLHNIKHNCADKLYDKICEYDFSHIKKSKYSINTIIFYSKYDTFDLSVRGSVSALVSTLRQYQNTQYLQQNKHEIIYKLSQCKTEISNILSNKWQVNLDENNTFSWDHRRQQLEECNLSNLLYILHCILLNDKFRNSMETKTKLQDYAPKIIKYFKADVIDGVKIKFYTKEQFVARISKYIDPQPTVFNIHLLDQLGVLYDVLTTIDMFKLTAFYIKTHLKWNKRIQSLKKCSLQDMIFIVIYILSDAVFAVEATHNNQTRQSKTTFIKLGCFKDKIIEYFVINRINGFVFCHWLKHKFIQQLAQFINYQNETLLIKFYFCIKNFDFQNMADISMKDAQRNDTFERLSYGSDWSKRSRFNGIKRVGYKWDDGAIVIADVLSDYNQENRGKIKLQVKLIGAENGYLRQPFWNTLPNDRLCKPNKQIVQQSHLRIFDKWMMILRIKNNLQSAFEANIFSEMVSISETHPQIVFTLRYNNYAVKLKHKTYDNVLQSLFASSLISKCRHYRCKGKPKIHCYCDINGFQKYTYCMIMTIMMHRDKEAFQRTLYCIEKQLLAMDERPHVLLGENSLTMGQIAELIVSYNETMLEMLQEGRQNTYALSTKLASLLPLELQKEGTFFKGYQSHLHQWLLDDFYNIVCSACGGVNKSIMINRVFHYSSTLRNCRTCGVIVRPRSDIVTKQKLSHKPALCIEWFCSENIRAIYEAGIDEKLLCEAINKCVYIDGDDDAKICTKYGESELLIFLKSLLREKYDELTYYLSKFWDDINEWKALRVAIATNYFFYAVSGSSVTMNVFMTEAGIYHYNHALFKDCFYRALFDSIKDSNKLINMIYQQDAKQDKICTDLQCLTIFRTLSPSVAQFAKLIIQKIKQDFPQKGTDYLALIKRLQDYKVDANVFRILTEKEFTCIASNNWKPLRNRIAKCRFSKDVSHKKAESEPPKKEKLRQEVVDKIDILDGKRYDVLMQKAQHIKKKLEKHAPDHTIEHNHIMAVLLFVDFPELRHKLFTLFSEATSSEALKKIYQEYGIWLKLLTETINLFGGVLQPTDTIYYSVKQMLFNTFTGNFWAPIMASNRKTAVTRNSDKIVLELRASGTQQIKCFDTSTLLIMSNKAEKFYILFGGELRITNIHFVNDDNVMMDESVYIEAISLFEDIVNDEKAQYQPSEQCKNILREYCSEKYELEKPNIVCDIPSIYYHDLFGDCFDYHQKQENGKFIVRKLVNELGINRVYATKKYREKLVVGSKCQIYSHSNNMWLAGEIVAVFTDAEGEWLRVKYGGRSVKEIQRWCDTLRVYKWYTYIWEDLTKQYPMTEYDDTFIRILSPAFKRCDIKYDKKLALRIKTILSYYNYTHHIVPDFDTFIQEANIALEAYVYENFKDKYHAAQLTHVENTKIEIKTIHAHSKNRTNPELEFDDDCKWNPEEDANSNAVKADYVLYDVGIFMRYDVLLPRFESLAEEVMCNDIVNISNEKFNEYLDKAKEIHFENSLIMVSSAEDYNFGIEKYSPVSIAQIIAIIIHTEETNYSRAFTKSCLSLNNTDSNIVIQNHCNNFYWFGRKLYEFIQYYGQMLTEKELNDTHQLQGSTVEFKFNLFAPSINSPRATTQSMDLAQHFSGDNGVILELIPKYRAQLNMTKFIDLSLMSQDYDVEKRLFFGKGCAMQIGNIIVASNKIELKKFVAPLLYLEKITLQTIFNQQFYNVKHIYNDISKGETSDIQKTLSLLLKICADIRKIQRSNIKFSDKEIESLRFQLISKYFPMQTLSTEQNGISYIVNLLLFWCQEREFLSFESFPAELPFMSTELKQFFMKDTRNGKQINMQNIQLIMPNIKYYRDCNKEVKYVESMERKHDCDKEVKYDCDKEMEPDYINIIETINGNLKHYYTAQNNMTYNRNKNGHRDMRGKFKAWCIDETLSDEQVYSHINDATSKYLCTFDPDFPYNEIHDVFGIIKQATVPGLLSTLYAKRAKINKSQKARPKLRVDHSIIAGKYSSNDSIHRLLSNCQRHEVPGHIVRILDELKYFDSNYGRLTPSEFKDKYRKELEKYYGAISKLGKATKCDIIDITKEINLQFKLFDAEMVEIFSDKLIEKLFTDIERTKPWKCSECWFINRKIMVNSLWRLYNQLNICGMCGTARDAENNYAINPSKQQRINTVDESKETDLKLPDKLLKDWQLLNGDKANESKCSINENENYFPDYVERWDVNNMILFVTKYMEQLNDSKLNLRKNGIKYYFEQQQIDGSKFLSMKRKTFLAELSKKLLSKRFNAKLLKLHTAILKININCNAMKRIGIILNHFHRLTEELAETNQRYPYLIRQFLCTLNESNANRTQLLDDFDHILKHDKQTRMKQPYTKCENGEKCIHLKRAHRDFDKESLSLREKQELFNSNDWRDFVFISYLDKIHCALLHKSDKIGNIAIKRDEHTIHRYSTFEVYATGVFFQYEALAPLHANLRQELTKNVVYPISDLSFCEAVFAGKQILNTEKMKGRQWRARETNQIYGIQIGDQIHIQHIICVFLYCSNSELCREFRQSYRCSQFDDNNTQIRSYHINNFYWMARFIYAAIQFFGEKPQEKDIFYHGQNKQFLFTQFSMILEAPTSTTPNWEIARVKFSGDTGIVLKLSPKYTYELNNNRYLNVSSISSYGDDENERLFAGMTVLAIIDIGYTYNNKWFWMTEHMKLFLYFERLITQTIHQRNNYNYGMLPKNEKKRNKFLKLQSKHLVPMIRHQMNRNSKVDCNYIFTPKIDAEKHYLYALFEHFCDSKHDYINLTCIHYEMQGMHQSLKDIFFTNTNNYNQIDKKSIKLIFPKLKGYKNHSGHWITF